MTSHRPAFKETQIFDWDSEPKEERPSEFQTTGFSAASGYYHSLNEFSSTTRARHSRGSGRANLMLALLSAIGLGTLGMYWLSKLLRG